MNFSMVGAGFGTPGTVQRSRRARVDLGRMINSATQTVNDVWPEGASQGAVPLRHACLMDVTVGGKPLEREGTTRRRATPISTITTPIRGSLLDRPSSIADDARRLRCIEIDAGGQQRAGGFLRWLPRVNRPPLTGFRQRPAAMLHKCHRLVSRNCLPLANNAPTCGCLDDAERTGVAAHDVNQRGRAFGCAAGQT